MPSELQKFDQVPQGCWVACIATLTGLPHDDLIALMPRQEDGRLDESRHADYHNAVNSYLRARKWRLLYMWTDVPKGFAMAYGPSARGTQHSVIVLDGELWHDPHPSRAGLLSVEQYEIIIPLAKVPDAL